MVNIEKMKVIEIQQYFHRASSIELTCEYVTNVIGRSRNDDEYFNDICMKYISV
jgi:hypothetical protein